MLKLSKKADYGLIAVKHLAANGNTDSCSASEIAEACGMSAALTAKVLQKLAKAGLCRGTGRAGDINWPGIRKRSAPSK